MASIIYLPHLSIHRFIITSKTLSSHKEFAGKYEDDA